MKYFKSNVCAQKKTETSVTVTTFAKHLQGISYALNYEIFGILRVLNCEIFGKTPKNCENFGILRVLNCDFRQNTYLCREE